MSESPDVVRKDLPAIGPKAATAHFRDAPYGMSLPPWSHSPHDSRTDSCTATPVRTAHPIRSETLRTSSLTTRENDIRLPLFSTRKSVNKMHRLPPKCSPGSCLRATSIPWSSASILSSPPEDQLRAVTQTLERLIASRRIMCIHL